MPPNSEMSNSGLKELYIQLYMHNYTIYTKQGATNSVDIGLRLFPSGRVLHLLDSCSFLAHRHCLNLMFNTILATIDIINWCNRLVLIMARIHKFTEVTFNHWWITLNLTHWVGRTWKTAKLSRCNSLVQKSHWQAKTFGGKKKEQELPFPPTHPHP